MKHSKNFNSSPAYTSESEGYGDSSGSFDDLQNYLEHGVIESGGEDYEQDIEQRDDRHEDQREDALVVQRVGDAPAHPVQRRNERER